MAKYLHSKSSWAMEVSAVVHCSGSPGGHGDCTTVLAPHPRHVPHRVAPPRTHIASPTMSCVSIGAPPEDEWAFVGGTWIRLAVGGSGRAPAQGPSRLAPSPHRPSVLLDKNIGPGDAVPQTVVSVRSETGGGPFAPRS